MTPLGKSLVFHLKYMAQMNHLYGDGELLGIEQDLTGLEDAERVRQMTRTVGAAAYDEAVDFLELCGKVIEHHFLSTGIAALTGKSKRAWINKHWDWRTYIQIPSVPNSSFTCGVWLTAPPETRVPLAEGVCGVVVPWLWSKGGLQAEDAFRKSLGDWSPSGSTNVQLGEERGCIYLACIPIKPLPPDSFEVDRELLIAEVKKTIQRIGPEQITAIASFVAGLNRADES